MTEKYDTRTIWLHWITAVLVVALWCIAKVIDWFPRGNPRVEVRSIHMTLGMLLGVVLIVRVVWRLTQGRRLPREGGMLGVAARGLHDLLYAMMFATVGFGLANASIGGDSFYNLFKLPPFVTPTHDLAVRIDDLHGTLGTILLILAGLHAAAGLLHHYVFRDGVLRRMLP